MKSTLIGFIYENGLTWELSVSILNLKLQVKLFDLEIIKGLFVHKNTDLKPIPLFPILIPNLVIKNLNLEIKNNHFK